MEDKEKGGRDQEEAEKTEKEDMTGEEERISKRPNQDRVRDSSNPTLL